MEQCSTMLEQIVEKLKRLCEANQDKIPYTLEENGTYNNMDFVDPAHLDYGVSWWTNGFFSGILWQLYAYTEEERFKTYARRQEEKLDQCFSIFLGLNHDVGFMWLLSAAMDYRLTGDLEAKARMLHAAAILAGRFHPKGNYIRAWNSPKGENAGWAIIDCLMNLSLLYLASNETGDPCFADIAKAHTDMVLSDFIRADGSVCHIVEFDPRTGARLRSHGGQGYSHGSCWSRGQAWAIYGLTNGYSHTGNAAYLAAARQTANYFIEHLPESYLVPNDFCQPTDSDFEDSSAACIASSGLMSLADLLGAEEGVSYVKAAEGLLHALLTNRVNLAPDSQALVEGCSVAYHDEHSVRTLIYADYFLLEAMLKQAGKHVPIW
jgi:unsaturated chondroitin disaccharide hydrolase